MAGDCPLRSVVDQVQRNNDLIARLQEKAGALEDRLGDLSAVVFSRRDDQTPPHGTKRKREESHESPMKLGDETNGHNEHDAAGHLLHLAKTITEDLRQPTPNETIHLCRLAPLYIIATEPESDLELALERLNGVPFAVVPKQWRRLFEDATLHKVALDLKALSNQTQHKTKRLRLDSNATDDQNDWLSPLIIALDKASMLTGLPGRKGLFYSIFQQLCNLTDDEELKDIPESFDIDRPPALDSKGFIARANEPLTLEKFQTWLNASSKFNSSGMPLIIPGATELWAAATKLWQNPRSILKHMLGGRRMVPIEIGRSYTDDDWSQVVMPMREYMTKYLLPQKPDKVGYLAQYDLFDQVPTLKADITTPEYCYTEPPKPDAATLKTSGLSMAKPLDGALVNAWLGPKGTRTPLHTDPYHNILVQVVGYKYVRLYAPDQTPNLYPRGVDDNGINMENTSEIDVKFCRSKEIGGDIPDDVMREMKQKYPLFENAEYKEAILAPGECLYVPLGWWHYVESLSTSFSVSFWWN
jgi:hypothetical protein